MLIFLPGKRGIFEFRVGNVCLRKVGAVKDLTEKEQL